MFNRVVDVVARGKSLRTNRMNLKCLWYMQKEVENTDLEFGRDICVGYNDPGIDNMQELLFSCPVISNSLQSQGLQHTRPPCPPSSPRVCPSSCSLHWWCYPAISSSDTLFSFCPQYYPASGTFPMSAVCIRWPEYWSFSFSISPSNEYSRLISLKTDWFDLLAVQGTFRSLLQHHSSKSSILWHSARLQEH